MSMASQTMKVWYQSYVDEALAGAYLAHLRRYLGSVREEQTEIDVQGLTPPDSYAHPLVEFRCAQQVVKNAIHAARAGYDAFIVGHIQDSGLWEAKSAVDIPVLGLGEVSLLYALTLGVNIGIVTINPRFIPGFYQQIKQYGLQDRIKGVHAMPFQPGEITQAFESRQRYQEVLTRFRAEAEPLVAGGVDVLIPGGGIPMLLFANEQNFNIDGAPVLEGLSVLVKMTELTVKLRRLNGLSVSRTADFKMPPPDVIQEFLDN